MRYTKIEEMYTVTEGELQRDPDAVVGMVTGGNSPIRILGNDGDSLVMMAWEQYKELFGSLHAPGELEEIEESCRKKREAEMREEYDFSNARENPYTPLLK